MKILVTGATGYIGSATADAFLKRGHQVVGTTRSERSAASLRARGIEPVAGDFRDPASLTAAVRAAGPDVIVSAASVGASAGDNARSFARDREAVVALQRALTGSDQRLIFTSGSAVFGVFNGGDATDVVYDEDSRLPLPPSTFAPARARVPPAIVTGFGDAMAARVETERAVLDDPHTRGIVVRPGLVYGRGGSYDLPALIARAVARGRAGHLGRGATTQSYVHIDDLAELFCLAAEQAPDGAVLHGTAGEATQLELAQAVNALLDFTGSPDSLTLEQMLGVTLPERVALAVTARMRPGVHRLLGAITPPSPEIGLGVSLSLNKRLASTKTQSVLGWRPEHTDILEDIAHGSYRRA